MVAWEMFQPVCVSGCSGFPAFAAAHQRDGQKRKKNILKEYTRSSEPQVFPIGRAGSHDILYGVHKQQLSLKERINIRYESSDQRKAKSIPLLLVFVFFFSWTGAARRQKLLRRIDFPWTVFTAALCCSALAAIKNRPLPFPKRRAPVAPSGSRSSIPLRRRGA